MIKTRRKVGTHKFENKVLEVLKNAKEPVTIKYIADRCELGWGTARAILFDLALRGKISMQHSTPVFITIEKVSKEDEKIERSVNR